MIRLLLSFLFAMLFCVGSFAGDQKLNAVSEADSSTAEPPKAYISLEPKDGVYNIVVLGDSLANGLHQGLTQINKDNELLKTARKSKVNTGLVRVDRYDWNKGANKIAKSGKYQIAVVLLGLNDLQTIREKGKAHHFQTDGWVERYQDRVERMMSDLKKSGLAVYWTGIPVTDPKRYQTEYKYLNEFYRTAAKKTGVRFVDTWNALLGRDGNYSPFWKDADGKLQEIRAKDGVHFTPLGYQIFAGFVDDVLKKDIAVVMKTSMSQ